MRILVTGATGNVGAALVRALAEDRRVDEVVAVARRLPKVHARDDREARVVRMARDVTTDELDDAFAGTDVVVHLAWKMQPVGDPVVTWNTNVVGSGRVFEAARANQVGALVVASSVGAYSPAPADARDARIGESWPTHGLPTASYGREKAYVERMLDTTEACAPEMRVVRLRPAFTFRTGSAAEQRRIFAGPFVPEQVLGRRNLPVLPLPAGFRLQSVHTHDVVDAYLRATFGSARGAFNLAAEPVLDGPTLADLVGARHVEVSPRVERLAIATAWHARLVPVNAALFDLVAALPLMDTRRARSELGWDPTYDAASAIDAFLDGLRIGAGEQPPLEPSTVVGRVRELRSVVGHRDPAISS